MITSFLDSVRDGSTIAPKRMAERLRIPMTGLAKLAHLNRNTMASNAASPVVQAKLGQIAGIIAKATELSEDEDQAIIWFKFQPIPGFANRTAEQLVEQGHAAAVMTHLGRMEDGVYS